jgi:hypothetical protein
MIEAFDAINYSVSDEQIESIAGIHPILPDNNHLLMGRLRFWII